MVIIERWKKVVLERKNNIYELSDEQIKALEEGQLQFKNGQFLKSEDADNEIEEWTGKVESLHGTYSAGDFESPAE